jgi:GNAT superfamily N-acetyltransferase
MDDGSALDVAAADRSFVGSFLKLVEHVAGAEARPIGGVTAYATGLPISLFNGAVVVEPAAPSDLTEAIGWLARREVPFEIFIRADLVDGLAATVAGHRLAATPLPYPGMIMAARADPPPAAPGVAVRRVGDEAALDGYQSILLANGAPPEVAHQMFGTSWLADPDARLFAASLDGVPVATGLAIRTGDVSGVYNIGTHPAARRRGVGTAVTAAAVDAARAWGCDRVVLQASPMGESLYRAMGFRTVVTYRSWTGRGP